MKIFNYYQTASSQHVVCFQRAKESDSEVIDFFYNFFNGESQDYLTFAIADEEANKIRECDLAFSNIRAAEHYISENLENLEHEEIVFEEVG